MMTLAELKAKLTADVGLLQQDIAKAQQYLAERQTMLLKTQGALEALALLEQDNKEREP
jgi:hypothetical protein